MTYCWTFSGTLSICFVLCFFTIETVRQWWIHAMGGMVMVYGKEVPVAQVRSRKQTPVAIAREET